MAGEVEEVSGARVYFFSGFSPMALTLCASIDLFQRVLRISRRVAGGLPYGTAVIPNTIRLVSFGNVMLLTVFVLFRLNEYP